MRLGRPHWSAQAQNSGYNESAGPPGGGAGNPHKAAVLGGANLARYGCLIIGALAAMVFLLLLVTCRLFWPI